LCQYATIPNIKMDKNTYFKAYFEQAMQCVDALRTELSNVEILTAQDSDQEQQAAYFFAAQTFNTRLQQNPLAIVFCENSFHVSKAYEIATKYQIPIRVRAGGHDHEGESSGTNVVLIDVSKMNGIEVDQNTGVARIGVGNRFDRLVTELANQNVMIAHGTCSSVSVTGFTFGGGWGPWTRKKGMNCEYLKGATIMLGDGKIVQVDENENGQAPPLLWALRGGGGMSYGIVTELRIQTFPLPTQLIKFQLEWNIPNDNTHPQDVPTLHVLKAWEQVIQSSHTSKLIGAMLKIMARPEVTNFDYTQISHYCILYGFWEGTPSELEDFKNAYFPTGTPKLFIIDNQETPETVKAFYQKNVHLMNDWDREHLYFDAENPKNGLQHNAPISPFKYGPAPHKVTSRTVHGDGLGEDGFKQLLLSLTSPFVQPENSERKLVTQLLLHAVAGDYYRNNPQTDNCAFPYKDRMYFLQYQVWWNTPDENLEYPAPSQDTLVYENVNRGLDWIHAARTFPIPNTSGAFISFKDSSIPTRVYFDKNYEKLKNIKKDHSKDPYNHFRSPKTII